MQDLVVGARAIKANSTNSLPSWSSNSVEDIDNKQLHNKQCCEEIKAGKWIELDGDECYFRKWSEKDLLIFEQRHEQHGEG